MSRNADAERLRRCMSFASEGNCSNVCAAAVRGAACAPMRQGDAFRRINRYRRMLVMLSAVLLALTAPARSAEALLHSFNYTDGAYNTYSAVAFDAAGNLYGTTRSGGEGTCFYLESCGIAFELMRGSNGKWTERVLYDFAPCDLLGIFPRSGFTIDAKGNLYGTTDASGCSGVGPGAAFELSPSSGGTWTESVIHQFAGGVDGANPQAALTFDGAGNLYGTTSEGGHFDNGTIFELLPVGTSAWTIKTLHLFTLAEGYGPASRLTVDRNGNLYGTTGFGGAHSTACGGSGCGTAFELKRGASGNWKLKVLHSFGNAGDGAYPVSGLTVDSTGNLFGVTAQGGILSPACFGYGCGTVYELTREKNETWTEQIIHYFGSGTDGNLPRGDLIFDASGAMYGTATLGGVYGAGNAFRLLSSAGGTWKEQVLHNFGNGKDGVNPYSGMIFDRAHNLYGTTAYGGTNRAGMCQKSGGCGTVFEITP